MPDNLIPKNLDGHEIKIDPDFLDKPPSNEFTDAAHSDMSIRCRLVRMCELYFRKFGVNAKGSKIIKCLYTALISKDIAKAAFVTGDYEYVKSCLKYLNRIWGCTSTALKCGDQVIKSFKKFDFKDVDYSSTENFFKSIGISSEDIEEFILHSKEARTHGKEIDDAYRHYEGSIENLKNKECNRKDFEERAYTPFGPESQDDLDDLEQCPID